MKLWLLDAFRHTTFNTTSQPLPTMKCRLYEITLIEPNEPYHANIPIPVPHYWRDEVKKQLDEDDALGIIRKIPHGETTDWCMRMVVVSKRDGKPRRTVDFQPLNKYSKREVHYTEPPFSAVSSIPPKMYKSSCDAFSGYHQVPLAETSIALTTSVTPWGRYQYITDIRSWFGLVNQLSPFVSLTPLMEPFRELLKPSPQHKGKTVFWNEEMQINFEQTKEKICSLIHDGLTFFDTSKPTACVTDWSKKGIGFAIVQKHCNCPNSPSLFCCNSGWKLIFCGSRHLSEAELNYAPIEGEALAVTCALRKGKPYLIDDPDFIIVVDHKPLLRVLGDRNLADIDNPRLFKLKERTLPYSFTMKHIPGARNIAANSLSRYPTDQPDADDLKDTEDIETHASFTVNALVASNHQRT